MLPVPLWNDDRRQKCGRVPLALAAILWLEALLYSGKAASTLPGNLLVPRTLASRRAFQYTRVHAGSDQVDTITGADSA